MTDDPFIGLEAIAEAKPAASRPQLRRPTPKAQALLSRTTHSSDLMAVLDNNYIVKGILNRGELAVLYGPSNTGKTFFGLDGAKQVSRGDDWQGRRTRKGRVFYTALEGGQQFVNRLMAQGKSNIFVMSGPLPLTGPASQAAALAETVLHLQSVGGEPFALIVIDTLARAMGAADENTAPAINDLVIGLDKVRQATGAAVLLIHHVGKDVGRGLRGHSALNAAIDTEIELSRDDDGIITAEVRKQRNGPTGAKICYRLRQVELGCDADGDPVTTCVVEPVTGADNRPPEGQSGAALHALDQMIAQHGNGGRGPVPIALWKQIATRAGVVSLSLSDDNRDRAFRRAKDDLVRRGLIAIDGDLVSRKDAP